VLEGDLTDFSLPDILRLLSFTSKSGQLGLQQGDASGRVVLVDGHVRDVSADARRLPLARRLLGTGRVDPAALRATLAGRETLPSDAELASLLVHQGHLDAETAATALRDQAVDAGFDLLRWRSGSFRFDTAEGEAKQRLAGTTGSFDLTVDALLAEVDARREAWSELAERTGDATAVVTIVRPPDAGAVRVEPDGWELLALIDGRRRLEELVELSGRGEFATRRTLAALLEQGVVEVGPPGDGATTERLLTAHRELTALETKLGGAGGVEHPDPVAASAPPFRAPPADRPAPPSSDAPAPSAEPSADHLTEWTAELPAAPSAEEPVASDREDTLFGARHDTRDDDRGAEPVAAPASAATVGAPAAATQPSSADRSDDRPDPVERVEPANSMPRMAAVEGERPAAGIATPTTIPPSAPGVTPLRTRVRADRLATDPTIDPDLVTRLIDGVERL
jgi:hypothetical protein